MICLALLLSVTGLANVLYAGETAGTVGGRVYIRGEIREELDMTEAELSDIINRGYQNGLNHKLCGVKYQAILIPPADENLRIETRFFGSLTQMMMALDAGLIKGACVPEFVGKYLLAHRDNIKAGMFEFSDAREKYYLGFYNNKDLRDRVNKVLSDMTADGTLYALQEKYIRNFAADPEPVEFERFDEKTIKAAPETNKGAGQAAEKGATDNGAGDSAAERSGASAERSGGGTTLRVAVTGDLPPIDYVAEDGRPAGFNTALLAEIGRRLKVNVEIKIIESSARTMALVSGAADVIFWYLNGEGYVTTDMQNGIQLSNPYYELENWIYIERK